MLTCARSQRGATMVETVIILPLLLFVIFVFIWIGITYHEKATLSSALSGAIRLAATRGDKYLMNSDTGVVRYIDTWITDGGEPHISLNPLLAQNLDPSDPWGASYYNSSDHSSGSLRVFYDYLASGTPLRLPDMPAIYTYTLLYINQSLRNSLGKSVRFPCDPYNPIMADALGCVGCFFLNPDTFASDSWSASIGTSAPPPTTRIAIQCDYRPDSFIIGPLSRMLSIISGGSLNPLSFVFTERRRISFANGAIERD